MRAKISCCTKDDNDDKSLSVINKSGATLMRFRTGQQASLEKFHLFVQNFFLSLGKTIPASSSSEASQFMSSAPSSINKLILLIDCLRALLLLPLGGTAEY